MKILVTTPCLKDPGGVASYYSSLLPHISENCNVHITTFEMGSAKDRKSLFHPLLDQLRFIRKLKSEHYDLIHINPSLEVKSFIRDGLFTFWAKRKKLPVIIFFHGWNEKFYGEISGLLNFFFDKIYKEADAFLVLASEFKSKLRYKGIVQPIHLMTTTVDESLLKNFSINTKIKRFEKTGPIKLLFLSRIEKEKGAFETIDACRILIEQGYDLTLSIAGDGSANAEVENYIALNGLKSSISTLGYVRGEQKRKAFEEHDIYCFPTYYGEGMPTTVLEAMAFGMPVVTRPVGGIKDFFVNGKMGYLSQSTRPEEIAESLEKLLSDKDHICNIANHNYVYAKNHFMASKVAERLISLYRMTSSNIDKNHL